MHFDEFFSVQYKQSLNIFKLPTNELYLTQIIINLFMTMIINQWVVDNPKYQDISITQKCTLVKRSQHDNPYLAGYFICHHGCSLYADLQVPVLTALAIYTKLTTVEGLCFIRLHYVQFQLFYYRGEINKFINPFINMIINMK